VIEIRETESFSEWLHKLRDAQAKARIAVRVRRLAFGQTAGQGDEMSKTNTKPFDPAEYLDDSESIAAYLTDALESEDPVFVADALGVVARARGMSEVASKAGLSRESLYRALSADGNPEFATVLRVLQALDLRLSAVPVPQKKSA